MVSRIVGGIRRGDGLGGALRRAVARRVESLERIALTAGKRGGGLFFEWSLCNAKDFAIRSSGSLSFGAKAVPGGGGRNAPDGGANAAGLPTHPQVARVESAAGAAHD